jgi:uncharacterized caspase-like protein
MHRILAFVVTLCALLSPGIAAAQDAGAEKRIALVIGNAGYQTGALATPANDAGLIAQTLQAAGFDVVGSRDLDQDTLRRAFRDFLAKAQASGADTVAIVYLGGYGLQLEGENYFVPVDATIARDTDVPAEAIRISDYSRPLAALRLKASIVVLDLARANSFSRSGNPLAGGLALVEPEPGTLIAFNAAPGTVAPEGKGAYGAYAQALAEMMREGGLPLTEVFDRTRLRVNDVTGGGQVPWHASRVEGSFVFFERAPDAPPPIASVERRQAVSARPIPDLGAQDAYLAAIDRDSLEGYLDFLAAYPQDPMARRIRAIVAARREAITWRRTRLDDTREAYWSYLHRYPDGPHAWDARRRLAFLTAPPEPPPSFTEIVYDVPPPPPDEIVYVERPVLVFNDPIFDFEPPPAPPVFFLPPPPPEFVVLPPPPAPVAMFVLPCPEYRPVPVWVRTPVYVAPPPPNNVIYQNVHNTVVINNTTNVVTITTPKGETKTLPPPPPPAPAAGAPPGAAVPLGGVGPALPPSVARKAIAIQQQPGPTSAPGAPGQPHVLPSPPQQLHPLPGAQPPSGPQGQPPGPQQAIHPPAQQPGQPPVQKPGQPPRPQQAVHPPAQQPGQPPVQQQGQPPGPQQAIHPPAQPAVQAPVQKRGQPPSPQQAIHPPAQQSVQAPIASPGVQQQRQQQLEQQRQQQVQQQRQQQLEQQRLRQVQQQRQQQLEQQRQQQAQQQRQQQLEQQRQQQVQQQRQQQLEQQRLRQVQQQRQQQLEQQRQQQVQQQRQQQLEQQRQQQVQQQRQQQLEQQRQQQVLQQHQQQIQQQLLRQQQVQQQPRARTCGGPNQPTCPR